MKKLLIIIATFFAIPCFGQLNSTIINPFATYYDTVKATFLVSIIDSNVIASSVWAIEGYEVYEHTYKKGRGWVLRGDYYYEDTDEHLKTLWCRLDRYKKILNTKKITIWQVK